jgi:hypothetical protein
VSRVKNSWTKRGLVNEAWEVLRSDDKAEGARLMLKLVLDRGLPLGNYVLNGQLVSGLELEQTVVMMLTREQQVVARLVMQGKVTDDSKSILADVLASADTFTRYHSILDERHRAGLRTLPLYGPQPAQLLKALMGSYLTAPAAKGQVRMTQADRL